MKKLRDSITAFDLYGRNKAEIESCSQHLRKINLKTLCFIGRVCIVLSFFVGCVPMIITKDYFQAVYNFAYIFTAVVLIACAKRLLSRESLPGGSYIIIHLFNIFSYTYAIIAGLFTGSDNPSVVFIILIVALHAFFMLRASTSFMITFAMVIVFCISSYIFKDTVHFIYDVRNVILAMFISVPMNYMVTKSRITNLVEHKRIKEEYSKLYEEFTRDSHTGLLTKAVAHNGIEAYCSRCLSENIPVFAIMIDIDYFKEYNDTYGHVMGDEALEKIGQKFSLIAVEQRVNIGRIGGDEFMTFGTIRDEAAAIDLCRTISSSISNLDITHKKSPEGRLTASIGLAFADKGTDVAPIDLYRQADRALYNSKEHGRNRIDCQKIDN